MFSSIRFKLTLWYTCVLGLIVSAFSLLTYSLLVRTFEQQTDRNITEVARNVASAVEGEQNDGEERQSPADKSVKEALEEYRSLDHSFIVTRADGSVAATSGEIRNDVLAQLPYATFSTVGGRPPLRIGRSPLSVQGTDYALFVVYSLSDQRELEEDVRDIFLISVPLSLVLAGLGGYFLARRSLAPISQMSARAARITAASLHERLPIRNPADELGRLASVFNDLLDRLDREFDRQRRFMTDASHELRTPLAIVRGESDVALLQDKRPADEYRDSLKIVNQESQRLSAIVEDLFTLARADSGQLAPLLMEVYADEVVLDCVRTVRTLAESRFIGIHAETQELLVNGDELLLHRLFMNLLDNAIKYNYSGGSIRVVVDGRSVKIGNTGQIIPEGDVAMIFERFYRGDKSHTFDPESATSGAGLGLSISKVIAEIHSATIEYSHLGIENVFTVTFPGGEP